MDALTEKFDPLEHRSTSLFIAENEGDYRLTPDSGPLHAPPLHRQGEALRVAMALVAGASDAAQDRHTKAAELRSRVERAAGAGAPPDSDAELTARLQRLSRIGDRTLAEQLRLLPRFDDAKLWQAVGCRDCIQWMDRHLGLQRIAAFERLRMARALQSLPVIESLFALGKLSYSKVRELTRVADAHCERELAAAALDLSVSETAELCRRWRFADRAAGEADGAGNREDDQFGDACQPTDDEREADDAMCAFDERSLTVRELGRGRCRITIDLPLELSAEVVKVLECMEDQLREDDREPATADESDSPVRPRTARQFRADALVHMSRRALAHEGEAIAKADRYRVLLSAGVDVLPVSPPAASANSPAVGTSTTAGVGPERPQLIGFGPIAHATARRLAETATMTVLATLVDGEVVGVSHDTRLWPRPMVRAIIARDRCCQMPGCTRTRFGHAHHVVPVALGGRTDITNACLLCSTCHRAVHEGRFSLERVAADTVDLGDTAESLSMSERERSSARERVARVQRFRLVRSDGQVVAGPRRLADRVSTQKLDDDERIERLLSLIAAEGASGTAQAA